MQWVCRMWASQRTYTEQTAALASTSGSWTAFPGDINQFILDLIWAPFTTGGLYVLSARYTASGAGGDTLGIRLYDEDAASAIVTIEAPSTDAQSGVQKTVTPTAASQNVISAQYYTTDTGSYITTVAFDFYKVSG